ncbi:chaperonin CPN60-1, mitochondrial-like isoform X2 [Actinidia eriantha]|uniref:chaperonin CPN60-1, mitochondrial-like isoform X2 n=1 Tax=Actinidia eriantha TaxID=165200 RepID=UPI002588BCB6|nr:chaperonin CPN60-1, mitochondrial-like isoform X2 [Actinidia eriantha]
MYRFAVNPTSGARISRNGSHQIEFGVEVVEELADAARVAMGPKKYVASKLLNYLDLALCQSIAGWETLYNEFEGNEAVTLSWKKDIGLQMVGIVPGGGVTLLSASKGLEKLQIMNINQKIRVQIIQNVLKAPVHKTVCNTGVEGTVFVGKLLEQDDPHLGYDAAKDEYVDMVSSGTIDPLKAIRTSLVDTASVSALLTTTEDVIELPKDENEAPALGAGGMGGWTMEDVECTLNQIIR